MTGDKEVSVKNQSNSQELGIDSEAGVSKQKRTRRDVLRLKDLQFDLLPSHAC